MKLHQVISNMKAPRAILLCITLLPIILWPYMLRQNIKATIWPKYHLKSNMQSLYASYRQWGTEAVI